MDLAARIETRRLELGVSMVFLAKRLGMWDSTLQRRIKRGSLTAPQKRELALALGYPADAFKDQT